MLKHLLIAVVLIAGCVATSAQTAKPDPIKKKPYESRKSKAKTNLTDSGFVPPPISQGKPLSPFDGGHLYSPVGRSATSNPYAKSFGPAYERGLGTGLSTVPKGSFPRQDVVTHSQIPGIDKKDPVKVVGARAKGRQRLTGEFAALQQQFAHRRQLTETWPTLGETKSDSDRSARFLLTKSGPKTLGSGKDPSSSLRAGRWASWPSLDTFNAGRKDHRRSSKGREALRDRNKKDKGPERDSGQYSNSDFKKELDRELKEHTKSRLSGLR